MRNYELFYLANISSAILIEVYLKYMILSVCGNF